jgi:hypothetical protein
MKMAWLGFSFFLAACGGSSIDLLHSDLGNSDHGGLNTDLPDGAKSVLVSGYLLDPEKLAAALAMNIDPAQLIADACVPEAALHAISAEGTISPTVMTDSMCNFTVTVPQNQPIHIVTEMGVDVVPTYDQATIAVNDQDVTGAAALTFVASNPYSVLAGLASARAEAFDDLLGSGICVFDAAGELLTSPFTGVNSVTSATISVTPAGFLVYADTDATTMPPTLKQQATSPLELFAIVEPGLTTPTTITIDTTAVPSPFAFAPASCTVQPGYVTLSSAAPTAQ